MNKILKMNKFSKTIDGDVYLMYRPVAIKDRENILEPELMNMKNGSTLILDFSEVKLIDLSYADEIILVTISNCKKGLYGDRYIAVSNMNSGVKENLEGAIYWRNDKYKEYIYVVDKTTEDNSIIGQFENTLKETFMQVSKNNGLTAKDLTLLMPSIDQRNANTRLKRLYDSRIVRREEISEDDGTKFKYVPV